VERPQQQRSQQQQQGGVPMHDLVSRLMQLGLERPSANDPGGSSSDDDDDAVKSISCRSGGSSNSTGAGLPAASGEWKRLNSRSCGDLLLLASKQQMACVQRASDSGPAADASEGQLDCFGASYNSLDAAGMAAQEDSSRSLGSVDQDQGALGRRLVPPGAVSPATVGAAAGSSGSGRRRRPLPRTPSRIILSPAAPDGSGESSGAPRLFVAIPKSGDERRSRRSSSVAATPRVPFTPASGMSILTPASARAGQGLKQLSSSLVGRKPGPLSPTAAAAAEAAANMPYNVAVAAAQLLSCGNSNAREAAAAVVAAAAEKGDSSTPLPSPLHVSAAAAAEQRFSDDGSVPMSPRVPRTSPCSFQHPPPTPVHPAVAAAAAAAITAAAESAATSRVMAHLQLGSSDDEDDTMQLPACLSPQRSPYRLSSSSGSPDHSAPMPSPKALATSAPGQETIPEGSEEDAQASDAASSSSEEWWCQDMTGLTVRDIMTGPVQAVSADADMVQAKQLMMQHNLPGMLVDAGPGQAPGFLTRGDFFKANMMRRKVSRKRPHKPLVRDIMSPVLVVDATMTIESCAQVREWLLGVCHLSNIYAELEAALG
jgi:CBS domain-containing protein